MPNLRTQPAPFAALIRAVPRGALLALALIATSAQAQWLQSGFGEGKTYANTVESKLKRKNVAQLATRWTRALDEAVISEATQADGRLFACADNAGLFALLPSTGQTLWSQPGVGLGWCGVPALGGGQVYVASSDNHDQNVLSAFDQATGQPLWTTPLTPSSPNFGVDRGTVIDSQRVYVGMPFHRMSAVNRADGSVAWETVLDPDWTDGTAPSVGFGRVFVCGSGYRDGLIRTLLALDAASGAVAWSAPLDYDAYEAPMVLGSRVYVIDGKGLLLGFDPLTGQRASSLQLEGGGGFVALVGHDDRIFAVTGGRFIQAIDVPTNQVLWSRTAGHGLSVKSDSLVWANHQLYMISNDQEQQKRLIVMRASDGKITASLPYEDALYEYPSISVVDGRVLVGNHGILTAFGL